MSAAKQIDFEIERKARAITAQVYVGQTVVLRDRRTNNQILFFNTSNVGKVRQTLTESPDCTAWVKFKDKPGEYPCPGFEMAERAEEPAPAPEAELVDTPAAEEPPAPAPAPAQAELAETPAKSAPAAAEVPAEVAPAAKPKVKAKAEAAADAEVQDGGDGDGGGEGGAEPKEAPPMKMKKDHKAPSTARVDHLRRPETLNEFIRNKALAWVDVKISSDRKTFVPKSTCANTRIAILALRIDCRHDLFHGKKLVGGHAIDQWAGEISDDGCQMLRVLIQKHFGFDPGRENVHDAAAQLCLQNPFDPVCDYLDGLQWDGKPRLDKWLITYLGAEDSELNRTIGRLVLVAAVRRARRPGCKFDEITVLEGPEGTQKSTAIATMAGAENFSDQTVLGLDEKRQMELVKGRWLYEIADLAGMRRGEVEAVKAFTARSIDRGRAAYGRHVDEQPRRCVFIGTTNDDKYLKSQTGNRRFWPVKTGRIAIDALRRDRDQLWAEAAQAEAAGESIRLPEHLWSKARVEQDARLESDPWDDVLESAKPEIHQLSDFDEERISSATLLFDYLKIPPERQTKEAERRLAQVMRRLGWTGPTKMRVGGRPQRGYRRPVAPVVAPGASEGADANRPPWKR